MEVLIRHLLHTSVQTRVTVLDWIYQLHIRVPNKVQSFTKHDNVYEGCPESIWPS